MQVMKSHFKKGDTVVVISGKEKNKTGKILQLITKKNGVIVEGLNMIKRHVKARNNESGSVVENEAYIHASNVMLYCSKCSKPVRVRRLQLENGDKKRNCVKCGSSLEN